MKPQELVVSDLDSFDDFKMHVNDIRPVKTGEEFIRSWILDQDIEACQSGPVRNHVYGNNAMTKCTNMFASSTVFNTTCSDYVDYGLLLNLCEERGDYEDICDIAESAMLKCLDESQETAQIDNWRAETGCGIKCANNQIWSECGCIEVFSVLICILPVMKINSAPTAFPVVSVPTECIEIRKIFVSQ